MKYAFYTLGCKVNQYETQAMEHELLRRGHTLGTFDEPCDCYIVNTCTVTAVADKKNRNIVRRCRRRNPQAIVAVCGCGSQLAPEDYAALGVDVIGGSGGRMAFLDLTERAAATGSGQRSLDNARARTVFEPLEAGGLTSRTRAMLKIQDGCDNFCAYCVIPFARGPVRSLPQADALEQVARLRQAGYREIVVTGIEIASWGRDLPGSPPLTQLLAAVCAAAGDVRVRLGSLEPRVVDEDFCRTLRRFDNLCPQFHLSMQSGCDAVLRRMNRHYDTARYLRSVALLREAFSGCAITTDLIVGFPGETDAEADESLAFIRTCGFAAMHVFPYSRRAGTVAAKLPGQIPNAVKQARAAAAIETAEQMRRDYLRGMLGTQVRVLFEQGRDGEQTGHAENGVRVYCRAGDLRNRIRPVRLTALYADGLFGELIE